MHNEQHPSPPGATSLDSPMPLDRFVSSGPWKASLQRAKDWMDNGKRMDGMSDTCSPASYVAVRLVYRGRGWEDGPAVLGPRRRAVVSE